MHVAVDGGGTKTIAILFRESGEIVKGIRKEFGSNVMLMKTGEETEFVFKQMVLLLDELCDQDEWNAVQSVTFTIPGFHLDNERLQKKLAGKDVGRFDDAPAAYVGALGDRIGVCVSAGTGGVAAVPMESVAGGFLFIGGWGTCNDDAGGAYYVGMLALRRLFRDADWDEYCLLSRRILEKLGENSARRLADKKLYGEEKLGEKSARSLAYEKLYGEEKLSRRDIAQLAILVGECAADGCEVSKGIFDDCAYRLAEYAFVGYKRVIKTGDCPVALVGGLKKAGAVLIEPFKKYLAEFSKRLVYTEPMFENYIGTVVFALQRLGVSLNQERLGEVKRTENRIK